MCKVLKTQQAKTLCLPYYSCVFSSTKLVIRAEEDLPGTEGGGGEIVGEGSMGEK
jgi:hypothetical protein